jgi:hypothetical protein
MAIGSSPAIGPVFPRPVSRRPGWKPLIGAALGMALVVAVTAVSAQSDGQQRVSAGTTDPSAMATHPMLTAALRPTVEGLTAQSSSARV